MMPEYAGLDGSPLLLPKSYKTEKVWAWTTLGVITRASVTKMENWEMRVEVITETPLI
jgi:hypothetical protein